MRIKTIDESKGPYIPERDFTRDLEDALKDSMEYAEQMHELALDLHNALERVSQKLKKPQIGITQLLARSRRVLIPRPSQAK